VADLRYQATCPIFFLLQDFLVDHETFLNDFENIVEKFFLVSGLNRVQIFLILFDTLNLVLQKLVDRLETLLQLLVFRLPYSDVGEPLRTHSGVNRPLFLLELCHFRVIQLLKKCIKRGFKILKVFACLYLANHFLFHFFDVLVESVEVGTNFVLDTLLKGIRFQFFNFVKVFDQLLILDVDHLFCPFSCCY
jgi:hypothetical protein